MQLNDVCRHIRSKNAGPFWITIDLFFQDADTFKKYHNSAALAATSIGKIYNIDPKMVQHYPVTDLNVLKISYPRPTVQGGELERDLHSGQQYVRLLKIELDS